MRTKLSATVATLCFAASLLCITSCKEKSQQTVFEKDEYGVVTRINPESKTVYLVFTAHYSENDSGWFENFDGIVPVLDCLKEKGVKGSFFPTGKCFIQDKYKEPIRRIIDEGHYLSAHSFAHLLLCEESDRSISRVSADSIAVDFAKMEECLQSFGLVKNQYDWMIPPYETYNTESVEAMHNLGFHLLNPTPGLVNDMDWTTPEDSNYVSAQEILDRMWDFEEQNTLNGMIILVHAMVYPGRSDEDRVFTHLGEIIDTLQAKGYTFATMKDVPRCEQ